MSLGTLAITPTAFACFGDLLCYLRRRAQLTQRDLAIAVGYSDTQISRLEQNQRLPDPTTLAALFVPALGLEHAPEWVARLLDLAEAARHAHSESAGGATTTTQQPETTTQGLPESTQPPPIPQATSSPLRATKLYTPRARADLVPRPRLTARVGAGLRGPLTLITAPAGFGKTTLLAEWLTHQRLEAGDWRRGESSLASSLQPPAPRVAWLSLDAGDNDPISFLRYLVATLQTIAPTAGLTMLALLETPQPQRAIRHELGAGAGRLPSHHHAGHAPGASLPAG